MFVRLFFTLITLVSILSFTLPAYAIEATGEGINQRTALNAALRQAVEMSMGTEVEANSLVENFQVVRQQILNHTKGFVTSYRILNEETSENGLVRIHIEAEVDDNIIKDSKQALNTLMQMAAHPRVMVVGLDEDFDALSSLSDEYRLLTEAVETTLREDFKFNVLDIETIRLKDKNTYRFSDRKNNLARAKRAQAEFVIFVEVLKSGEKSPLTLRLESVQTQSARSLAKEEIGFSMADWTRNDNHNRTAIITEAKDHIYAPSAQVAAALIDALRKETYEDGQRFEISFQGFDEKITQYIETDLTNISGYSHHKIQKQKKNALSLSYWSLLKAGQLNQEINRLLLAQDQTFNYRLDGNSLLYRFKDPMFE